MVMPRSRSRSMESSTCVLHLAGFQAAAELDEAVGQRGFAVIDVGDDGEVAYEPHRSLEFHRVESCGARIIEAGGAELTLGRGFQRIGDEAHRLGRNLAQGGDLAAIDYGGESR